MPQTAQNFDAQLTRLGRLSLARANDRFKITYESSPTLARFHESDAFYRGVRGPVRGGKSTAMCIEIMTRARGQAPGKDGVRRTRWVVVRSCYDDQTEILTEKRGWQLFKDLDGDRVAQLKDGFLEFVEPSYHFKSDYVGEMVGFQNEGVDFLVTPTHKMYVSKRNSRKEIDEQWGEYDFRLAKDIYGHQHIKIKRNAQWQGVDDGYSESFFEWLGFWFAEGCAYLGNGRHRCTITQSNDLDYVRTIFDKANLPFTENKRKDGGINFVLSVTKETKPLIIKLSQYGKSITKAIPNWIKEAPTTHLRSFIKGFLRGDGSTNGGSIWACTSSKQFADDLQEIALRAGLVANVVKSAEAGVAYAINGNCGITNAAQYRVTFVTESKYDPILVSSGPAKKYKGWHKQTYSGKIYCVEVPTHIVYVRRNGKAFWCSQTYRELLDTTIKTWQDWFRPELYGPLNQNTMSHHLEYPLPDKTKVDCEVLFRALDRPDDVRKLLSMEVTGAWVNEARETPKGVIDVLGDRVGQYPALKDGGCTWRGVMLDTNSPDDDHWWYKLAEEERPAGWEFFNQPGGLSEVDGKFINNPGAENVANLEPGYYLTRVGGKNADYIRVYYCNQYGFIKEGKPVYPEYIDSVHCSETVLEPVKGIPVYVGLDFGLTPASTLAQRLPIGRWQVFDELVTEDMGAVNFAKILKTKLLGEYGGFEFEVWGDPSGDSRAQTDEVTPFQIMRANGIPARPAPSNDPVLRREAVVASIRALAMDGKPGFLISPKCRILRKGMAGGYYYKRVQVSGDARFQDKAEKNKFSHVCFVGGTKISIPLGYGDIEELRIGDMVNTPYGSRPVINIRIREAETVRLSLSDGGALTCTKDHPFWKFYCYSPADSIQYSELLSKEDWLWKILFRLHRYVVGRSGQYINFSVFDIIGNRLSGITNLIISMATNIFTARYGNIFMEKSRQAMMCIIKTLVPHITTTPTLILSANTCTIQTIPVPQSEWHYQDRVSKKLLPVQLNGEERILTRPGKLARKVVLDIGRNEKKQNWWTKCVLAAAKPFKQNQWIGGGKSIVRQHVGVPVAGRLAWTMKIGYALYAAAVFILTSMRRKRLVLITAKENCPLKSKVYNITVADAHCYYANGILVSNCESLQYLMLGAGEGRAVIRQPKNRMVMPTVITQWDVFA